MMPRFGACLTAGLCRVCADEALASNISKRIELKSLFVGSGSLVPLFQPREYISFPNPCPYILGVECDGTIEVYPGFVQIVRIVQCLSLLGKSQRDQSKIGLAVHYDYEWINVAIVEGGGVGAELDLVPQIRGVESGLEHCACPLV